MNSKRIIWIDWGKSICMFLVILGHCHLKQEYITTYIYSFHMPFFFIISGLLCKDGISIDTLKKDIKYLIIPYFTYGIITIFFHGIINKNQVIDSYYYDFLYLLLGNYKEGGPIWFLLAIFFCKQLFRVIQLTRNWNWIYYPLAVSSILYIQIINIGSINLPYHIDSALCGLPFFILGYHCKTIPNYLNQTNLLFRLLILALLIIVTVFSSLNNGTVVLADCMYGNNLSIYYINAILGTIVVILICGFLNSINSKFVNLMSQGTIVTLGIHGHILLFLHYYLAKTIGYYSITYSIALGIIYSIIAQLLCIVLIQIIRHDSYAYIWGLKKY